MGRSALVFALLCCASARSWDAGSEAASLERQVAPVAAPVPAGLTVPVSGIDEAAPNVRIILREASASLDVAISGMFRTGGEAISSRTISVNKGDVAASGLTRRSDGSVLLSPVDSDAFFRIGSRTYRGSLRLVPQGRGCTAVNELPLEDYLRGVVPGEIGRKLDARLLEAVKAQAVVARTYAVRAMAQNASKAWDLRDDVRDQVYEGRGGEDALCTKAVLATRGRILVDAAGRPVDAYYHSTSGGATADIAEVWPGKIVRPYLRGVDDTAPDGRAWGVWSPSASWTETWPAKTLHAAVRRDLPSALAKSCDPGEIVGLSLSGHDPSGRARKLVVRGKRATCEVLGDRIRWALKRPGGKGILRSTRFDLESSSGRYIARGTGNGHGVGLSQTGALGRARAGQTCEIILTSYYPGAALSEAVATGSLRQ